MTDAGTVICRDFCHGIYPFIRTVGAGAQGNGVAGVFQDPMELQLRSRRSACMNMSSSALCTALVIALAIRDPATGGILFL